MSRASHPHSRPKNARAGAGGGADGPKRNRMELTEALAKPRATKRQPIGELLREAGGVGDGVIQRILSEQASKPHVRIGELLLANKEIAEQDLYKALSEQMGVVFVRLSDFDVEPAALALLPPEIARSKHVLPLMLLADRLVLATDNPADSELMAALRFRVQLRIETVLATPLDLDEAIAVHYPALDDLALAREADRLLEQRRMDEKHAAPERMAEEQPVVRLVENLLLNAVHRRASDIHLSVHEANAEARYRIDGSLVRVGSFHKALMPAVIARLKVLANMDVAERRLPQDGAIHLKTAHGPVDLRLSVMNAARGESMVIRVLDPSVGLRRLADIGFSTLDQRRFGALIERNQGLLLVTGPTGSGKTTTLYAALQQLNTGERHVLTVEDPVEYHLDGVEQIQVQPAIGFGFPQALRQLLRHDPDVILIGEIRDTETAKIAVESALTGHVVLSTLHTNSAAQTITRLVEIGIAPYLVTATLAGVLAQRLVRRNCEHCKVPERIDSHVRKHLALAHDEMFWRGRGCSECGGTGGRGRVAVYELLEMSPQLRELIRSGASHEELEARAVEGGMVRLTQQALTLARAGTISLNEVFRARLN